MFSISNIIIQSSILKVNNAVTPPGSAYDPVIKGNAAVGSLEGFVFTALSAVTVTASAFTAQNVGAKKYDRVKRALGEICLISVTVGVLMSTAGMLCKDLLLSLYGVENAPYILSQLAYDAAFIRMLWKWPGFFIFAIMNACSGTLRGLGKSSLAALIAFIGTCVFRVVWIYTAFEYFQNLESIHISYPISWFLTGLCCLIIVLVILRKKTKEQRTAQTVEQNESNITVA
jgi:Na+-driven multidrug efflux pump